MTVVPEDIYVLTGFRTEYVYHEDKAILPLVLSCVMPALVLHEDHIEMVEAHESILLLRKVR